MSDYEGLEYLAPGFDPASLTVPRLRSIFVTHDITYPAAAKKAQLVQIFEDEVKPRAKKIVSTRARARRTSKGITDAESQDSTVTEESVEEEVTPPLPTPRTTRRNPTSRLRSNEPELEPELPRRRTRSPTKKLVAANPRQSRNSDTDTSAEPEPEQRTVRKTRKSEAPAPVAPVRKIKLEDSDDIVGGSKRRESAFTYDNPFQSGSSPPSESRSISGERRRKSLGTATSARKSTSTTRRRTDGLGPSTSSTFQVPISELESLKHVDENGVEASEEFTPEEQLEMSQEIAAKGVTALGPRRNKPQQRGFNKSGPLWLAFITLLGGYATWYRQEKVAVGYCGVGRDAMQVIPANVEVPDWVKVLAEPQCEPCPQHAYCSEYLNTVCEADFLLKPHPLSLGGIVPIPPTCEADGVKVRKVKAVADKAVEELRQRRAKFECGDLTAEPGLPRPTLEIDANDLKNEVSKQRAKKMGTAEFEELWATAMGEIVGRDEVVDTVDGNRTLLSSNSLARLSFTCAVKRSSRLAVARHRIQIGSLAVLTFVFFYLRAAYKSQVATKAAIPHLVSLTLDRLATQATLHAQDREAFPENWISIGQLRDDVLRDEHSLSKREATWKKVRAVVEMNANIRASQRESRNGEISRVWEWIGAVGGLESGEKRRKSGRVSWGVYDEASSPVSGTDAGPEVVRQKWEENRPIY